MTPEEIYDCYGEKMFHYAALCLSSLEDAEDVLQETFFRLARYPIRWAFVRNPKAFIFKVLRNEMNRFLRRKIGRPPMNDLKAEDEGRIAGAFIDPAGRINPEGSPRIIPTINESSNHLPSQMTESLAALPEDQREAVILKVFQDLSFKEIAAVCGVSVNTAASRYRYGLEKLRTALTREK
jgi:RNA polymerase sigma-70 factor (ECF subfamily)